MAKKRAPAKKKEEPPEIDRVAAEVQQDEDDSAGCSGTIDKAVLAGLLHLADDRQAGSNHLLTVHEARARLITLPMPALATRFLFHSEGYPLGRFVVLCGKQESCKTAFGYEIGRWHRLMDGQLCVTETEVKDSVELRDSFFNYDPSAWVMAEADTQDEWNRQFIKNIEFYRSVMDGYSYKDKKGKEHKVKGIGQVAPFCLMVDSISAVTVQRIVDKMDEDGGAPDLSHPIGAKLLSTFFQVAPKYLRSHPFSFLAVSHRKDSIKPEDHGKGYTTGGQAPKHQMTMEVELQRRQAHQNCHSDEEYDEVFSIPLYMRTNKNSLGAHEDVLVEMCWYFDTERRDPATGDPRQYSYFDWHAASIGLINDCHTPGDKGGGLFSGRAKQLRELIDLDIEKTRRLVSSRTLGISREDRLNYRQAGEVLEKRIREDPTFCASIYEILGIRRRTMFKKSADFKKQIADNYKMLLRLEKEGVRVLVTEGTSTEVPLSPPIDLANPAESLTLPVPTAQNAALPAVTSTEPGAWPADVRSEEEAAADRARLAEVLAQAQRSPGFEQAMGTTGLR